MVANHPQQDVLRFDKSAPVIRRLFQRQLQNPLRWWRERKREWPLRRGALRRRGNGLAQTSANALTRDAKRAQDPGGDAVLLFKQAEKDVLDASTVVPPLVRLLDSQVRAPSENRSNTPRASHPHLSFASRLAASA
ncbi:MAG TPA: hypothetical protein VGH93_09805, partial [Solirubrobacteraceae bacterium]